MIDMKCQDLFPSEKKKKIVIYFSCDWCFKGLTQFTDSINMLWVLTEIISETIPMSAHKFSWWVQWVPTELREK